MNLPKTTKMGTQKVKKVPIRILFPQCIIPHLERMNRLKQLLGKCESDIGLRLNLEEAIMKLRQNVLCLLFSWLFLREASWRKRLTDFRATVARIGRLHKEVQT